MTIATFGSNERSGLAQALAVRREVFVAEQGFSLDGEVDEHDRPGAATLHALAIVDGLPVGTGRLFETLAGEARIGRMAVVREHRGHGVGDALLRALVGEARVRGYVRVLLSAQLPAVGFYERLGFRTCGPDVDDEGVPHRPMALDLRDS